MDSGKLDYYPFLSRKPREVGSDSVAFSVLYGTGHLCVYGKNQAGGYWKAGLSEQAHPVHPYSKRFVRNGANSISAHEREVLVPRHF